MSIYFILVFVRTFFFYIKIGECEKRNSHDANCLNSYTASLAPITIFSTARNQFVISLWNRFRQKWNYYLVFNQIEKKANAKSTTWTAQQQQQNPRMTAGVKQLQLLVEIYFMIFVRPYNGSLSVSAQRTQHATWPFQTAMVAGRRLVQLASSSAVKKKIISEKSIIMLEYETGRKMRRNVRNAPTKSPPRPH